MSRKSVIFNLCVKEVLWAMVAAFAALNFYTFPSTSPVKIVSCVIVSLLFIVSLAMMVAGAMVAIDDIRQLKKDVVKHQPPSTDVDGSMEAFRNSEHDGD